MDDETPEGASLEAPVKFFNRAKGFGFVTLPDGQDVFFHVSSLTPLGLTAVDQGDVLVCEVGDVPRGRQRAYLAGLGCRVEERGPDDWLVTPPSWRYDIGIEEDVVEALAQRIQQRQRLARAERVGVELAQSRQHLGLGGAVAGVSRGGALARLGVVWPTGAPPAPPGHRARRAPCRRRG